MVMFAYGSCQNSYESNQSQAATTSTLTPFACTKIINLTHVDIT